MFRQKMHERKGKTRQKMSVRVSADFPWQILQEIVKDIRTGYPTFAFQNELKDLELIIRRRKIKEYFSFCKSTSALNRMSTFASAESWEGLVKPGAISVLDIRLLRLLTCFQKYDFPDSPFDTEGTARKTFRKFEELCRKTNLDPLFRSFKNEDMDDDRLTTFDNVVTSAVLRDARTFIQKVLGVKPDLELISTMLRHGPGASVGHRGKNANLVSKNSFPIDCGSNALGVYSSFLDNDARRSRTAIQLWLAATRDFHYDDPEFVPYKDWIIKEEGHSVITFVPKDAEKKRTICIEPTANVYLQLGIDGFIRRSLKRWGIDLDTQEKNQNLAHIGSLNDKLATIDLSGASDSIARVWLELFPHPWAILLSALRMDKGKDVRTGEVYHFEKLSAMGNGFTFVVETLIFASLFYGVICHYGYKWRDIISNTAFYGDDIVIPTKFYSLYSYILRRVGFRENMEKTFSHGPVRESCGHDYYKGYRIDRPTFKKRPTNITDIFVIHNLLYLWSERAGLQLTSTLDLLKRLCNRSDFGPASYDNVNSWLFSEKPRNARLIYDKNYHCLFYKIKRYLVGHPKKYRHYDQMTELERLSVPLCYLDTYQSGLDISDNSCNCKVHNYIKERVRWGASPLDFFQLEKIEVIRTTMAKIPVYDW